MKKVFSYGYVGTLCLAMMSCDVSREVTTVSDNPNLSRYLSINSDSANCPKENPVESDGWQNNEQLREKVNPEKEASWAEILHNMVKYFRLR